MRASFIFLNALNDVYKIEPKINKQTRNAFVTVFEMWEEFARCALFRVRCCQARIYSRFFSLIFEYGNLLRFIFKFGKNVCQRQFKKKDCFNLFVYG